MIINVLDYLDHSVSNVPEKVVFADINNQIIYRDLQSHGRKIGTAIGKELKDLRQPIVVFVERNIECLVAFMGVAYSGNFYVPIDIQMPIARIQLILETLKPVGIVNTPDSRGFAAKVAPDLLEFDYQDIIADTIIDENGLNAIRRQIV
ncbi:MAG: acyl-CoA synthetase (AMP-forming)/AMP-acid ligase II, partial [Roseivirga sp.]